MVDQFGKRHLNNLNKITSEELFCRRNTDADFEKKYNCIYYNIKKTISTFLRPFIVIVCNSSLHAEWVKSANETKSFMLFVEKPFVTS